jgi:hypothetical protein
MRGSFSSGASSFLMDAAMLSDGSIEGLRLIADKEDDWFTIGSGILDPSRDTDEACRRNSEPSSSMSFSCIFLLSTFCRHLSRRLLADSCCPVINLQPACKINFSVEVRSE